MVHDYAIFHAIKYCQMQSSMLTYFAALFNTLTWTCLNLPENATLLKMLTLTWPFDTCQLCRHGRCCWHPKKQLFPSRPFLNRLIYVESPFNSHPSNHAGCKIEPGNQANVSWVSTVYHFGNNMQLSSRPWANLTPLKFKLHAVQYFRLF